ncbi:MAG: hypothetical protein HN952_02680 [Candidatus Cloacimonetes bacterium]|nr:hypothetical protein [Candidatus Cloacimonadota bacterium]MBT6993839.1 hypothetical protein [Candidatus Cloacimonadota bacterium]MBT7469582.1 hypothetical protein [Candidatus Cloacimonadota bacterium]
MLNYFNKKVKLFSLMDVKLLQFVGVLAGIILAKYFPEILQINLWWLLTGIFVFLAKPMFVIFFKK